VVAATVHVALTTGVDSFAGTDANDVFSGVVSGTPGASTFNAGDAINGGAGANRLELSDSSGALDLSIATVANIQTAAIDSTGGLANNAADLRGWSGLRAASVLLKSAAVQQLSVANTTALTVTNNAGVSTSGGATVNATVVATAPLSENNVAIAGDALTAVTVAGGNRVTIDNNGKGTLTSVSLAGAHGDALLTGAALTKVTLAGTSHAVTIVNATVGHTESLTLNGVVAGVITDDVAKALVVNTIGAASAGMVLQAATATTVTFTGDKALAVTLNAAHVSAVTLSSTGGFSGSFAGIDGAATITATTFSGPNTVALGAGQSYLGSIGVDNVSIVAAPSLPLRGGDGGATDVLLMNAGGGLDANANARITGFETLALGSLAAGDYNAAGFSHLEVNSGAAGAVSFSGVGRNTDLAVTGAAGQPLTYALLNAAGTTDGLNLALRADSAANASNTLNAVNIENITIITSDTGTSVGHAAFAGQLTLNDSALVNLNVRGNMGLHLVDLNDTAFSRVDASGITAGGFIWTTGALSATLIQASIIGSASGGDVINAASVVGKGVTIAEKAGTNAITGSATVASSLLGGTGADTIVGGIGNDSLYDGGGADVMTGGAGADHFVFGGSTAMIVQALGASGVNTATDGQTTESTSTFDVIMGQFAGNKLDLGNAAITATATSASAGAAGTMKLEGINLQALVDNTAVFALGFYDPGARSFIYAVNGVDSALTYDADASAGTHFETIILMGYQANAFATTIAAGVITL
jgi:hypothetical protein